MDLNYGYPFHGPALDRLRDFLRDQGLKYDDRVNYSVCLTEGGRIIAAGSLDGNILKCIAAAKDRQGDGLTAVIVTDLIREAGRNGQYHLFLFTKPENKDMFFSLGFYPIAGTDDALLMENKKNGIDDFVAGLKKIQLAGAGNKNKKIIGAIAANCNPFTNGHLYLIKTAAQYCDILHLFIISENKGSFPPDIRMKLTVDGIAGISNVIPHPTGPYLISAATFPDYFIKESVSPKTVNTGLDLTVFAERIAAPLGINHRFIGSELFDPVTGVYNRQMKEILPRYGIRVEEIPRLEYDGEAVSASRVRRLLREGDLASVEKLVPPATYAYLLKPGEYS
jgi:[citrate (pro-3S)-lyase] ligase